MGRIQEWKEVDIFIRNGYTDIVRKVRNILPLKGGFYMELAKVTSKGQVTIPIAIRNMLGIREGDKILFIEDGEKVILMNASTHALQKAQEAFKGVAKELNIQNEQDVVKLVKEIRTERGSQYKCE